jgi:16S rRNA (guanine966-N2)-methyltransferase
VISGTYGSRSLGAPRGVATRPTSDRLRETLFNVLAPVIEGAVFADLFAGSGAVGIEALSRGARLVYFVDQAPPAVSAIRANLASLGITAGFRIEASKITTALPRIAAHDRCDIIFLDPPYAAADDYTNTLASLGKAADSLLAPEGIVVAEHGRQGNSVVAEQYGDLQRYRVLVQGDAQLSFYRR